MRPDRLVWFDVDVFQEAIDAACNDTREIVKKAVFSTMGRSRKYARTRLSALIREEWNIKKNLLDPKLKVRAASRDSFYQSFEMTVKGMSISLSYFGARQYSGNRKITRSGSKSLKRRARFQGVEVTIKRGKKTRLTNAFFQTAGSGHVMILRRKGKGRYPIEEKAVISPASMFESHDTADQFEEAMFDFIEKTFAHELEWRLKQAGLA